jgi:hypothetical protein
MNEYSFTGILAVSVSIAFLIFLARAVSSNTSEAEAQGTPEFSDEINIYVGSEKVERFVDDEAGVVCWAIETYRETGLSCLPIEQTQLWAGK